MNFQIRMTARELAGHAQELTRSLADQVEALMADYDGPEFETMMADAAETAERLSRFLQRAIACRQEQPSPEDICRAFRVPPPNPGESDSVVVPLRRPPVAIPPITPEAIARLEADLRSDLGIDVAPETPVVVSGETDDARELQVAVAARRHGLQVERAPETDPEPPFTGDAA